MRTTLAKERLYYNWARQVTNLQIDITSHCNARCGACVRNKNGDETREELVLEHFDMEVWERLAKEDTHGWFIGDLTLNGNWGDPMMHPKLVEMLTIWTQYHPESSLYLHTNGSMRTKWFWEDLAVACRRFTNHLVVFAVDGLEDTHSIYRRKTNFNKIIENITAFSKSGGRSNVTMTLFEHNKHQVKEVEAIAKTTGAIYFTLRHSHGDNLEILLPNDVYHINANYDQDEYQVRLNDSNQMMSDLKDYDVYLQMNDKLKDERDEDDTPCPWYNDRQVQIDPWAKVWPCCHTSLFGVYIENHVLADNVDSSFINAREDNDLKKFSLTEVLSNDWFRNDVGDALNDGSWKQCQRICGVECGLQK